MNERNLVNIAGLKKRSATYFKGKIRDFLHKTELAEYDKLPEAKRLDWVAGRIALKFAYSGLIKNPKINVRPKRYGTGEPYISKAIYCSISHSHAQGVGIVAPARIGIDIEKVRAHKRIMLDYIATEPESRLFRSSLNENITAIWTIKESVMKAVGIGLGLSPKQLIILRKGRDQFTVEILKNKHVPKSLWNIFLYKDRGYYISVAYQGKLNERPKIHWHKPHGLPTAKTQAFS
jgi:phosphopantetheinyl transferase